MTATIVNLNPFDRYRIVIDGDMTASIVGPSINCKYFDRVRYQVSYTDADSPVGVISVQTCETNVETDFQDWPITSNMFKIFAGDGVLNASGTIDISGVGAGRIDFNIADPQGFIRPKFTFTSDGTADLMQIIAGAG